MGRYSTSAVKRRIENVQRSIALRTAVVLLLLGLSVLFTTLGTPFVILQLAKIQAGKFEVMVLGSTSFAVGLTLCWIFYVKFLTFGQDTMILGKALTSLELLDEYFGRGSQEDFRRACETILDEMLTGVTQTFELSLFMPEMPKTPLMDQLKALIDVAQRTVQQTSNSRQTGSTEAGDKIGHNGEVSDGSAGAVFKRDLDDKDGELENPPSPWRLPK
jgi:hypothetical protein